MFVTTSVTVRMTPAITHSMFALCSAACKTICRPGLVLWCERLRSAAATNFQERWR